MIKNRLDRLVANGKITSEQETAIVNEISLLKSKYNPVDKTNLAKLRQEFRDWLKAQNIDLRIFPMGMRMYRGWYFMK
jgi:polyhydroxyalkanoate synthesis regulator phasin